MEMPAELFAALREGQIDMATHFGPDGECVVHLNPFPLFRHRRMPARAVLSIVLLSCSGIWVDCLGLS